MKAGFPVSHLGALRGCADSLLFGGPGLDRCDDTPLAELVWYPGSMRDTETESHIMVTSPIGPPRPAGHAVAVTHRCSKVWPGSEFGAKGGALRRAGRTEWRYKPHAGAFERVATPERR